MAPPRRLCAQHAGVAPGITVDAEITSPSAQTNAVLPSGEYVRRSVGPAMYAGAPDTVGCKRAP